MEEATPIERACDAMGGQSKLAKALGVKPTTVHGWVKYANGDTKNGRPVPTERCPTIERLTGVSCEEMKPGVEWGVLRGKPLKRSKAVS